MNWVPWFKRYLKSSLPVCVGLVGNDLKDRIGTDFLYVDRAYWNRAVKWRIVRGGVHLTHQLDRPADRMGGAEIRPWRADGRFVVVIPPSKYQMAIFPDAAGWVEGLKLDTDREVRVKWDKEAPFAAYLEGAWAVVSYGSVAAVKAAMWGYPVLSGPLCPATPISCESLERPVLKDRLPWLRSLSYAQWTMDEVQRMNFDDYDYPRRYDVH